MIKHFVFIAICFLFITRMAEFMNNEADIEIMCQDGIWTRIIHPPTDNWKTFGQRLLEGMKRVPERVGQIDGLTGEKDTYASMLDRAVRCAVWLRKENVEPRDFIGICTHNNLDTFVPILAAIFTGVTFHPWWDVCLDDDLVKYFLKQGEPKVMFVNEKNIELIEKGIHDLGMKTKIIVLEDTPGYDSLRHVLRGIDDEEVKNFVCTIIEDVKQAAIIISTSGTTGYPKGILHSYNWLEKCSYLAPDKYVADSIILWTSGICWITGIGSTISLLKNCATAVIHSKPTAQICCELIEKYKINCLVTVVKIVNQFHREDNIKNYDLSSVKYIIYGGASVFEEAEQSLMRIFPDAIICFAYGCSEVGVVVRRDESNGKFGSCGKIRENCQIKVVDMNTGKVQGPNEEGEIYLKSPYMMLKYHKDPKSTQDVVDSDGWYHTNDLGYYDADGNFYIVDRMKEVIKYKTFQHVTPTKIEQVLLKHPDVIEAGVVAKPHFIDVEQPMAFITIRDRSQVTEEQIIKHVDDHLPDRMKLRGGVKILDKMPTTPAGKVSRRVLREMAKALAKI